MLDVIYGETRHGRTERAALQAAIEDAKISGTLYFGYPVLTTPEARQPIDALLVSKDCGVVGILIETDADPDEKTWKRLVAEQDGLYTSLDTQLGRHTALRKNRKLAIDIATITVLPKGGWREPQDTDSTFISLDHLADNLEKLNGIENDDLFRKVKSIVEHVVAIKPSKKRDKVKKEDSRGAKLKRIEAEIANLDRHQKQAAISTPEGPQRIRGLAGSGKTVVLALKAAYLHAQHPEWRIAVVFYTQSLYQQFQDLIRRFCFEHLQDEPDWTRIRILHAWGSSYREGFYYEIAGASGVTARNWSSALAAFGRETAFDGCCQELLSSVGAMQKSQLFDAILIDEAQDLPTSFFRLAYHAATSQRRIIWAYDELQQLAAETVPGATELFGTNEGGLPLVTLEESPGEPIRDVVLPVCYRNPPWTLTVAHGLGFGTARTAGLIQHFDDPTLWEDVGYEAVAGDLQLGSRVALRRRVDSYPEFFGRELSANDAISVHPFKTDAEQVDWVVASIQESIAKDELEPDDFLIVLPDEYTAKSRATRVVGAFLQRGMAAHHAGVHTERDVVFQPGSVAVAHIYRAKGNEAPFVYVLDAEYASSSHGKTILGLASRRNKLFTAITRSRAWVRICGVGTGIQEIANEVDCVKKASFQLDFRIPAPSDLAKMRRLHRDRTEVERSRINKQKQTLRELADALSRGEVSAAEFRGLPKKQRDALKKILETPGPHEE